MSARFAELDFEAFRALAVEPGLSEHERIGFPDSYRAGKESAILRDIMGKLTALRRRSRTVVDIGPGCGALARALVGLCAQRRHSLFLVDSSEMLTHLPDLPRVTKVPGRFPVGGAALELVAGSADAVLAYSVFQYVFAAGDAEAFLDAALSLLAPGGRLLLGDVPNEAMRERFLASPAGRAFAAQGAESGPGRCRGAVPALDDEVVLRLLRRARAAGYHAFAAPQAASLPMANRREDLLFVRP